MRKDDDRDDWQTCPFPGVLRTRIGSLSLTTALDLQSPFLRGMLSDKPDFEGVAAHSIPELTLSYGLDTRRACIETGEQVEQGYKVF